MTASPIQRLEMMIRARYPIIAVTTHEESRALDGLKKLAKHRDKSLFVWSISQGLEQLVPSDGSQRNKRLADPIAVLSHIMDFGKPTPDLPEGPSAIFVLKDFHRYMDNPQVCRWLRDLVAALAGRFQSIVLLSPVLNVPAELEKDVATLDFPLPSPVELEDLLESFAAQLPPEAVDLNGDTETIVQALQGLTWGEADSVLAEAFIRRKRLDAGVIGAILEAKAQIIKRSGALEYWPKQAQYGEIGGLDLLKAWCRETETALQPGAREYGLEPQRGVLIVGVPGCGKSLTAKAVAGGTRPLLRLDVGALFGSLVGQSEAAARNALKTAEAVAPAVVWLDEIEKALGSAGGEMDGGTSKRVLGTILTWLEETEADVFVVATANDIASLRPELVRRFDEVFFVDLPQPEERQEILEIHLAKRGRDPKRFDLTTVVEATPDFTGAELEKVVQAALRRAFVDGGRKVATEDLVAAAAETVPLVKTMAEGITHMRQWADRARPASSEQESGHQATGAGRRTRLLELD
jgi:ATP-dependent 26S proteasome regulatory subunit